MNKENQATTVKLMSMKIHNAVQGQKVKIICRSVFGSLLASLGFLTPAFAFAQSYAVTSVPSLFSIALGILNGYVVPIIFAIAFIMFLFGVYVNFIAPGASEEASKKGGQFVIWSIIGFVLMFSIWGLINIFINTFALQNNQPNLPAFGVPASSSLYTGTNSLSSLFSSLLGGGGTVGGTVTTPYSSYTVGQTITDPVTGQTFIATGSNTYAAQNGSCGSGISLGNGQCQSSTNVQSTNGGTCTDGTTPAYGSTCVSCNANGQTSSTQSGCDQINSLMQQSGATSCTDGSIPGNGASCISCNANGQTSASQSGCNTINAAMQQSGAESCTDGSVPGVGASCISCNANGQTSASQSGCDNINSLMQQSSDTTCTDGSTAGSGGCISCNSQGNTSSTQSGCDSINSSLEQGDSYDYNDCTLDGSC